MARQRYLPGPLRVPVGYFTISIPLVDFSCIFIFDLLVILIGACIAGLSTKGGFVSKTIIYNF